MFKLSPLVLFALSGFCLWALAATAVAQPQDAPQGASAPENTEAVAASPAEVEPEPAASPVAAVAALIPHDLTPWGMFRAADKVVKAVMIGLVLASLLTWTIWLAKTWELLRARRAVHRDLEVLHTAASLDAAREQMPAERGFGSAVVGAATLEREQSGPALPADGIRDRAAERVERIEARAGRQMTQGTGLLATIGSTAPFVGLFGTVWGIMNSFIGISEAHTTNLAVVAPGIAEALLATALGLIAAIPAVMIYNGFSRAIGGYRALLADASSAAMLLLGRDLDRERIR